MKIEPRGKYSGVKVHLDGDEATEVLKYFEASQKGYLTGTIITFPGKHVTKLGQKIKALLAEEPALLEDRTEEQVRAALVRDHKKIAEQLQALESGKDWKF